MAVSGWKLEKTQRDGLLARFEPRYARAVADHVTLKFGVPAGTPRPHDTQGEIVGRADDGQGVEAMVVRIAGTSDRPGGGTYHITWSLASGRQPRESNDVIAAHGWTPVEPTVTIALAGALF
jgi:hypothetical protein